MRCCWSSAVWPACSVASRKIHGSICFVQIFCGWVRLHLYQSPRQREGPDKPHGSSLTQTTAKRNFFHLRLEQFGRKEVSERRRRRQGWEITRKRKGDSEGSENDLPSALQFRWNQMSREDKHTLQVFSIPVFSGRWTSEHPQCHNSRWELTTTTVLIKKVINHHPPNAFVSLEEKNVILFLITLHQKISVV